MEERVLRLCGDDWWGEADRYVASAPTREAAVERSSAVMALMRDALREAGCSLATAPCGLDLQAV